MPAPTVAALPDARGPKSAVEALVRLRWLAIAAELLAVLVAGFGLGLDVSVGPLCGVLGVAAASNLALQYLGARGGTGTSESLVGPVLFLDTVLLTALLHLSGDASNPFSIVYLVQVTLAAVRATPRWTWAITSGSVIGYGTLFLRPPEPSSGHGMHAMHAMGGHGMHGMDMHGMDMHGAEHEAAFSAHLYGMWLAFAVTAVLIAFFVSRVARALEGERERADRAARLVSVSTLAAGAAHELSTPLSTIKLAASELERATREGAPMERLGEDARLIRTEVERMSDVLARLRSRSGETDGEAPSRFTVLALLDEVERETAALEGGATRVEVRTKSAEAELCLPRRGVVTAIVNLVKNALDASLGSTVEVDLDVRGERFVARVQDRGTGIASEVKDRLGEPFVTTKEPGRGMGLGLFLVRSLAESLTGSMHLGPREGGGALAELELPRSA